MRIIVGVNKVFMTLAFSMDSFSFLLLNIDIYNAFRQRSKVNKQTNKQKPPKKNKLTIWLFEHLITEIKLLLVLYSAIQE